MKCIKVYSEDSKYDVVDVDLDDMSYVINCEWIEYVYVEGRKYVIVCDDEGKYKTSKPTIVLLGLNAKNVVDYVVGDVLIFRADDTNEEYGVTHLSDEDISYITSNLPSLKI